MTHTKRAAVRLAPGDGRENTSNDSIQAAPGIVKNGKTLVGYCCICGNPIWSDGVYGGDFEYICGDGTDPDGRWESCLARMFKRLSAEEQMTALGFEKMGGNTNDDI